MWVSDKPTDSKARPLPQGQAGHGHQYQGREFLRGDADIGYPPVVEQRAMRGSRAVAERGSNGTVSKNGGISRFREATKTNGLLG